MKDIIVFFLDQHWQALTDKNNGITGPDGLPIQLKSIVPNAPSGQFVAVIDSGWVQSCSVDVDQLIAHCV